MQHLSGKKIAMIATDYVEEVELTSPRQALLNAGAAVDVIAPHDGEIKSLRHVSPRPAIAVDKILFAALAD